MLCYQNIIAKTKEEFNSDWESNFDRTELALLERSKDTKKEHDKTLKSWKCIICQFVTKANLIRTMAQHYVMQHFSEAIEYFFEEYFVGDKCQKLNSDVKKNSQGSLRSGKLVHVGLLHEELYPLLKRD